jgi:hypothetical protein
VILTKAVKNAVEAGNIWNASAERVNQPSSQDEGTENFKSAIIAVQAARSGLMNALIRLQTDV